MRGSSIATEPNRAWNSLSEWRRLTDLVLRRREAASKDDSRKRRTDTLYRRGGARYR
jgi:hypothetical protein